MRIYDEDMMIYEEDMRYMGIRVHTYMSCGNMSM